MVCPVVFHILRYVEYSKVTVPLAFQVKLVHIIQAVAN